MATEKFFFLGGRATRRVKILLNFSHDPFCLYNAATKPGKENHNLQSWHISNVKGSRYLGTSGLPTPQSKFTHWKEVNNLHNIFHKVLLENVSIF